METELTQDSSSLTQRLADLSPEKRQLIERLLCEKKERAIRHTAIPGRAPSPRAPLSHGQQRLWMLDQFQPHNPFYNESFNERFRFKLDLSSFHKALNEIVRRHESLRTTFQVEHGEPVQVIAPELTIPLQVVELRPVPAARRAAEALRLARRHALIPFDLAEGPLIRVTLYQLGQEDFFFQVVTHHIVWDGRSADLFMRELNLLYPAFAAGLPSPLPELPIQYADFAIWQRAQLENGLLGRQIAYWKGQLAGLPLLELPADRLRPAAPTYRGGMIRFHVSHTCLTTLQQLGQRESATLYTALLTAFTALLHRYTGQDDFAVGVPVTNRDRSELEDLIGFFINVLVARVDCSGNPSFRRLLTRVRETVFAAYANQDAPFETLVDELRPQRDPGRNPLFQVICQYIKEPPQQHAPLAEPQRHIATAGPEHMQTDTAKFDLRLDFLEQEAGLTGYLEYSSDLFSTATAERMVGHLVTILEGSAANPDCPIAELPLLTAGERREILVNWNSAVAEYPRDVCVHTLFEVCARNHPEALAVAHAGRSMTYGELDRRANQLAHYLRARGVGPEAPVAVCLERSLDMVLALLAVLKAGGAYLPLDPAYPRARLESLLARAGAPLVLTRAGLLEALGSVAAPCWCVDRDWAAVARLREDNPVSRVAATNLAYIIYTSGSTGHPRGVAIEHRSLMNLINWHARTYKVTDEDRATQVASPAFDAAVWEIWPYLSCGASLHIPDEEVVAFPEALMAWLAAERITLSFLPTPLAEAVLELEWPRDVALRAMLTGGDKLRRAPRKPMPFRLVNHYGPTENTVVTTFAAVESDSRGEAVPPIGRPIDNVRVYVLDRYGNPAPVGVPGELCIAGESLARGYFRLPELTAEKFAENHLERGARNRLYRTGDLARYQADGNLEFLGRVDHQVKIRGFRIEPGEIEAVLGKHPAVQECAVLAREERNREKRLVAYVAPNLGASGDGSFLATECQNFQVEQWRRIYQETYHQPAAGLNPQFNLVGWNSSYTGEPIPPEEMQEQVKQTIARVRRLQPARVLEIGCGTGLLLFELAPHCRRYVGADFSPAALEYVGGQLTAAGLSQVTLLERTADNFDGFEPGSFDAVILNSTVQYFPSADYLARVLEGAVRLVSPKGYVFVGDIRSLPLLETFYTAVELHRAGAAVLTRDLDARVRRRMRQELELAVAPEFFTALARRLPEIRCVDVMLKRGRHHNELTRFRYDVTLQVGGECVTDSTREVREWASVASLPALRETLRSGEKRIFAVIGVPNDRLRAEAKAVALIAHPNGPGTVRELRKRLEELDRGVDPENIWALERELPYQVHITWPTAGPIDCFDVVFQRKESAGLAHWSGNTSRGSALSEYTNTPIQRGLADRLTPALRAYAREHLPEYMIPSVFVLLGTMPHTPNGKLNRNALPPPDDIRLSTDGGLAPPRNELERQIAAIWQEVLGLDEVGIHDNFFDVGGHSLLLIHVHHRLRERLGSKHSITDLFRFSTISALAKSLAEGNDQANHNAHFRATSEALA